jgi:hypothetical protein
MQAAFNQFLADVPQAGLIANFRSIPRLFADPARNFNGQKALKSGVK